MDMHVVHGAAPDRKLPDITRIDCTEVMTWVAIGFALVLPSWKHKSFSHRGPIACFCQILQTRVSQGNCAKGLNKQKVDLLLQPPCWGRKACLSHQTNPPCFEQRKNANKTIGGQMQFISFVRMAPPWSLAGGLWRRCHKSKSQTCQIHHHSAVHETKCPDVEKNRVMAMQVFRFWSKKRIMPVLAQGVNQKRSLSL